jgi:hypothetical protein
MVGKCCRADFGVPACRAAGGWNCDARITAFARYAKAEFIFTKEVRFSPRPFLLRFDEINILICCRLIFNNIKLPYAAKILMVTGNSSPGAARRSASVY